MHIRLGEVLLRKIEKRDLPALYAQKNDPEVARLLGGFSTGYSEADLEDWLAYHRKRHDECIWAIVTARDDSCIGHVGLYRIDHRVRAAEFAIMIGDRNWWGRGVGERVTRAVLDYGWSQLNLRRISLTVLADNERAISLYEKLGFVREGCFRDAQYKDGRYIDVLAMAIVRDRP